MTIHTTTGSSYPGDWEEVLPEVVREASKRGEDRNHAARIIIGDAISRIMAEGGTVSVTTEENTGGRAITHFVNARFILLIDVEVKDD